MKKSTAETEPEKSAAICVTESSVRGEKEGHKTICDRKNINNNHARHATKPHDHNECMKSVLERGALLFADGQCHCVSSGLQTGSLKRLIQRTQRSQSISRAGDDAPQLVNGTVQDFRAGLPPRHGRRLSGIITVDSC